LGKGLIAAVVGALERLFLVVHSGMFLQRGILGEGLVAKFTIPGFRSF